MLFLWSWNFPEILYSKQSSFFFFFNFFQLIIFFAGISTWNHKLAAVFLSYITKLKTKQNSLCLSSSIQTHQKSMFHINLIFLLSQQSLQMFFLKVLKDLLYYFSSLFFLMIFIPTLSSWTFLSISCQPPLLASRHRNFNCALIYSRIYHTRDVMIFFSLLPLLLNCEHFEIMPYLFFNIQLF